MNKELSALKELDNIVKSDRLGKVFDVLEPRARRLAKQPSSVSFGVLFGAIVCLIGIPVIAYLHLTTLLSVFMIGAFLAAGVSLGVLVAGGREALRLERRARGLERYINTLSPVVIKTDKQVATKEISGELSRIMTIEIQGTNPMKQVGRAEVETPKLGP